MTINPTELTSFANKLADASGEVIRKYFRKLDKVESKDDQSPVTIADREAETAIRDLITQKYPNHGIQGEEFGLTNEGSEYQWIIDPIDGTLSFMSGRPTFGTLIGLLRNDIPLISIIDQPITGERWAGAAGFGASLNSKGIKTRKCAALQHATIATTGPNYFTEDGLKLFNEVSTKAKHTLYGGDCYLYALVASGCLDAAIDPNLKPHDFLPIIPLIEESGGIITDWQGQPLNKNSEGSIVIAGDKKTHTEIIRTLNK